MNVNWLTITLAITSAAFGIMLMLEKRKYSRLQAFSTNRRKLARTRMAEMKEEWTDEKRGLNGLLRKLQGEVETWKRKAHAEKQKGKEKVSMLYILGGLCLQMGRPEMIGKLFAELQIAKKEIEKKDEQIALQKIRLERAIGQRRDERTAVTFAYFAGFNRVNTLGVEETLRCMEECRKQYRALFLRRNAHRKAAADAAVVAAETVDTKTEVGATVAAK